MTSFHKCFKIFLIFNQVQFYNIKKSQKGFCQRAMEDEYSNLKMDLSGIRYDEYCWNTLPKHTYLAQRSTMITKVVPPGRGYFIALRSS